MPVLYSEGRARHSIIDAGPNEHTLVTCLPGLRLVNSQTGLSQILELMVSCSMLGVVLWVNLCRVSVKWQVLGSAPAIERRRVSEGGVSQGRWPGIPQPWLTSSQVASVYTGFTQQRQTDGHSGSTVYNIPYLNVYLIFHDMSSFTSSVIIRKLQMEHISFLLLVLKLPIQRI